VKQADLPRVARHLFGIGVAPAWPTITGLPHQHVSQLTASAMNYLFQASNPLHDGPLDRAEIGSARCHAPVRSAAAGASESPRSLQPHGQRFYMRAACAVAQLSRVSTSSLHRWAAIA
jgi:hypothetical protein